MREIYLGAEDGKSDYRQNTPSTNQNKFWMLQNKVLKIFWIK